MTTFHLPTINKVMETNFAITSKAEWNHVFPNQETTRNIPTFLQDHSTYYLLSFAPSEKMTLKACSSISIHSSIFDVLKQLQKSETVVVINQSGTMVGFINAYLLSETLLNSYQYLHAFFETIIKTLDTSITVINEHGQVLVWTEGAERIFSVSKEEILGKPITDYFDIDMLEIIRTLKDGRSIYRHQHQPRSDLYVLINSRPVYIDNKIVGAAVSETDITSQIRLNQELFNVSAKVQHLENEVAKLSPSKNPFHSIKGSSPAIKRTIEIVQKISSTDATVLILGESGVGKELFAKAIHELREPENAPFIPINCGAIPPSLFESELFGYEGGAFSGANNKGKKGKIELARGGTLFLDEIGEMLLEMQVKLLRVLQERKYYAVGGTKELTADFRVIAATNRNLKEMVKEGKFREDLYYRLNVVSMHIPPLRDRKEDIIELIHYFLYEYSVRYSRPIHGISQEVMLQLLQYEWPGNIRELRNVIERLVVFATDGIIRLEDLPFSLKNLSMDHSSQKNIPEEYELIDESIGTLSDELEKHERKLILDVLKLVKGNKQACAKRLGITRATLYNRMKKLHIPV